MGAQNQVACSGPGMVGPKLFVPVFPTPHPSRRELVLEAWAPCRA